MATLTKLHGKRVCSFVACPNFTLFLTLTLFRLLPFRDLDSRMFGVAAIGNCELVSESVANPPWEALHVKD